MREYFFLNQGRNSLFATEQINKGSFIICDESTGYKKFMVYRSANKLYNDCISISDEKRCKYEIIENCQKIYFDIDINLDDNKSNFNKDQKINIANQIPALVIDTIIAVEPLIKASDILVFKSHSGYKRSYHIVVDRWCYPNHKHTRKFFDKVMEHIPEPWKIFFDSSMYKKLQQFRLFLSTKFEKDRMKVLDNLNSKWKPSQQTSNILKEIFMASLVTNVNYCNYLPFEEEVVNTEYEEIEILDNQLPKLKRAIKEMPFSECFSVVEKKDSLIILRRLAPSYCESCSKRTGCREIHENENPFVCLDKIGNIYLNCRRGGSSIIGNVYDEFEIFKPEPKKKIKKSLIVENSNIEEIKVKKSLISENSNVENSNEEIKTSEPVKEQVLEEKIILYSPNTIVNSFSPELKKKSVDIENKYYKRGVEMIRKRQERAKLGNLFDSI